jgi:hypothetical protein
MANLWATLAFIPGLPFNVILIIGLIRGAVKKSQDIIFGKGKLF